MPTIAHEFDWPDRVVVGTIGHAGSREFYLQARAGARIVSIALEKEQSAVLAEKIDEILNRLMGKERNPFSVPAETPAELIDHDPLEQPVDALFRTGTMSLGWDPSTAQVVIEAYPYVETDGDGIEPVLQEPADMMLVRIPVGSARAFAERTLEVVASGRPVCPVCGTPMDADSHVCPLPDDI